jgi:hypothetical protein
MSPQDILYSGVFHSRQSATFEYFRSNGVLIQISRFPARRLLDGQEIKASRMDDSRSSYVEDRSPKEDTGAEHCQNIETDRRGYPPKGIQSRPVPRFASLIQFNQFNGKEPRQRRARPPLGSS